MQSIAKSTCNSQVAGKANTEIPDREIKWMRKILYNYFVENGRDLPWRKESNPYLILNTEIILQRTKAEDVVRYWPLIKHHLSTPYRCLDDDSADAFLQKLFREIGLPKRKKWIQKIAKLVKERGGVPASLSELLCLPGVGCYTSCATLAFAYNSNVGLVDANVIRLFGRFWEPYGHHDLRQKVKYWLPISRRVGGSKNFRLVYWGLLDLCARICTPRLPECTQCPLGSKCRYAKNAEK